MYEHGLQLRLPQPGLLARPERGLARREAGVQHEADALAAGAGLHVHPHADVARPLHRGRGGEVDLLEDLQHPPLLLHLHVVHVEEPGVVADQVRTHLGSNLVDTETLQ